MNDPGVLSSLEQRVAALESAYRRTRFAAVVFGAIAAVTILTAQSPSGPTVIGDSQGAHTTIGPDGVYVFDAQGKQRLRMRVGSNGIPGFSVATADGKDVVAVNGGSFGGFVNLSANTGTKAAYAGVYNDGTAGMEIADTQGKTRLAMQFYKDGTVGYDVRNPDSKIIASLSAAPDGSGTLQILDKNLVKRSQIGVVADGGSGLSIFDGGGKRRAYIGLYTNGSSGMTAYGSNGAAGWSSPFAP